MIKLLTEISFLLFIIYSHLIDSSTMMKNDYRPNEYYSYHSFPEGTNTTSQRGALTTKMTFGKAENKLIYSEKTISQEITELKRIETDESGDFISATRKVFQNGKISKDSLFREKDIIHLYSLDGKKIKKKSIELPNDKPIAVDASLLFLFRMIPFDSVKETDVFMVDYSGHKVNVTVHSLGKETVTVPAGTFSCLRIEVVVKILIFRPKITYWINKNEPRYLVKHFGKKGPFTPVYTTLLTSIEKE